MLNYCSSVNIVLKFIKDFVRKKEELTCYAQKCAINRVIHTGWQQQCLIYKWTYLCI